jgi:D-alanyl-D-alanine endopeptidase (penicillin-binding protein 7)
MVTVKILDLIPQRLLRFNVVRYLLITALALASLTVSARAPSTLIYNESKKEIVVGSNTNVQRPIASLTKLMTAMVALDYDGNLNRKIRMHGSASLPAGEYTRNDLMTAMLVRSDNGAAEALAADYPGGRKSFIRAMNNKAEFIGMSSTKFADPTGLSSRNISNAVSVGVMVQVAALYPVIKESSVQKEIKIERRRQTITLGNTNRPLLYSFDEILLSKTGFTTPSGWSVAVVLEKHQQHFSVIVLGARNKEERYRLTKQLIDQYFKELEIAREQELARIEEIPYNKPMLEQIKEWFNND